MKKLYSFLALVVIVSSVGFLSGCPSASQSDLEAARFLMDKCNPSDPSTVSNCNEALSKAQSVLDSSANTDVDAAILVSSANLGIAGVDFLQFAAKLGAQASTAKDFSAFTNVIVDVEKARKAIDPDNFAISTTTLRAAAKVLEDLTGTIGDAATFQKSAIEAIELFIIPAKALDTASPTAIDATSFNQINKSLAGSDTDLKTVGVDDKTIKAIRAGRCLCLQTTFLYTCMTGPKCLRDLVRCSNGDESANPNTEDTEQNYDGDGGVKGDRTDDCKKLLTTTTKVDDCKAKDAKTTDSDNPTNCS